MATSARLEELKKKFDESPRRYFAPLANEYRKLGDLPQAVAICRAHLPNQPGHVSGHIVLAQALYESGELAESRVSFESALDLDPENLIALRFLGDIAREQGDATGARGWYERVLDADPRNDEISSLLAELNAVSAQPAPPSFAGADAPYASETYGSQPMSETPSAAAAPDEQWSTPTPVELSSIAPAAMPEHAPAEAPVPPPPALVLDTPSFPEIPGTFTLEAANAPEVSESFEISAAAEPEQPAAIAPHPFDEAFAEPTAERGREVIVDAISLGDLEAVAEPSDDDWFRGASDVRPEPSAESFEASFFPDLASVTPPASPAIPTPSFQLEALPEAEQRMEEPVAEQAPAPVASEARDEDILSLDFDAPTAASPELPFVSASTPSPVSVPAVDVEGAIEESFDALLADSEEEELSAVAESSQASVSSASQEPALAESVESSRIDEDVEEAAFAELSFADSPVVDEVVVEVVETSSPDEAVTVEALESEAPVVVATDESPLVAAPVEAEAPPPDSVEVETSVVEARAEEASAAVATAGESVTAAAEETPSYLEWPPYEQYEGETVTPVAGFTASMVDPWAPTPPAGAFDAIPAPEPTHASTPEEEPVVSAALENDASVADVEVASAAASQDGLYGDVELPSEELAAPVAEDEQDAIAAKSEEWEAYGDSPFGRTPAMGNSVIEPAPAAFVTETMAELYLQQGFVDDALAIYRQLQAQSPSDDTLRRRIESLEAGGVEPQPAATQARVDRVSQSARAFFSFFALREPRRNARPDDRIPFADAESNAGHAASAQEPGAVTEAASVREVSTVAEVEPVRDERFSGVATNEEALTVPDVPAPASGLESLFSTNAVAAPDEAAAGALASAFSADPAPSTAPSAPSSGAQELSLQHLFRDVPARSPGAVTLDEFFSGGVPAQGATPPTGVPTGQERADIEQFTAWLEGLKKK